MTTFITLPNKDRSVLPSQFGTGDYNVKLAETLVFPGDWEVFLLSAILPYTWYNVTEKNNTLISKGVQKNLTPGNYATILKLVEVINTLLNTNDVRATFNPNTMRVSIEIKNGNTLEGPLLELLGFPADPLNDGNHISPHLADITDGVNSLLIYLSIIENTNVGSYQVPLLATIPLGNAHQGDILHWSATGPAYESHKLNTRSFSNIEVTITDTRGRSVDFNNYNVEIRIGIRKNEGSSTVNL